MEETLYHHRQTTRARRLNPLPLVAALAPHDALPICCTAWGDHGGQPSVRAGGRAPAGASASQALHTPPLS